jgi:hypothetical protein
MATTSTTEKPKAKAKTQLELNTEMMKKSRAIIKKCLDKAALAKSEDNETKLWCEAAFYAAQTLELLDKDKERLKTKRSIGFED